MGHLVDSHDNKQIGVDIRLDDYDPRLLLMLNVNHESVGLDALIKFLADFTPLLDVVWIGSDEHERGLDLLEESNSAKLSLVDAISFIVARDHDIERVFAFDRHFTEAGFTALG